MTRSLHEYLESPRIAEDYDAYFALNRLFQFDQQQLLEAFGAPGRLVDLGCGTGRLLLSFARRGFEVVGLDLSLAMLRVAGRKAQAAGLRIDRLQANLVELDCLRDDSADYCICMFSTLGMIRGRGNRQRVLRQVRRILKPGGQFALHVHNRWSNLYQPEGRRWLMHNLLASLVRPDVERGDKTFDYRGIPGMYIHTFTRGEIAGALRRAGFRIGRMVPLDAGRQSALPRPWLAGRLRANGWIIFCR